MFITAMAALGLVVIAAAALGCVWSYKAGHDDGRLAERGREAQTILDLRHQLEQARQNARRAWALEVTEKPDFRFRLALPPIPPQPAPQPDRRTMTWPAVRLSEDPTTGELRAIGDANVAAISDGVMA
jgi:hypothetical protein